MHVGYDFCAVPIIVRHEHIHCVEGDSGGACPQVIKHLNQSHSWNNDSKNSATLSKWQNQAENTFR